MRSTVRWLLLGFMLIGSVGTQADEEKIGRSCSAAGTYYCALSTIKDPATDGLCGTSAKSGLKSGVNYQPANGYDEWSQKYSREPDARQKGRGITNILIMSRKKETGGKPKYISQAAKVYSYNCVPCASPYEWNDELKRCVTYCPPGSTGLDQYLGRCDIDPPAEDQSCSAFGGNPINVLTGEKVQQFEPDMVLGQGHFPIVFARHFRTYNSDTNQSKVRWSKRNVNDQWSTHYQPSAFWKPVRYETKGPEALPTPFLRMRHSYQQSIRKANRLYYRTAEGDSTRITVNRGVGKFDQGMVTVLEGGAGWTVALHSGVTETFNARGQLVRLDHRQGGWQQLHYDDQKRLARIEHYQGYQLFLHYDSDNGRLSHLSNGAGQQVQYRYDSRVGYLNGVNINQQGWETYQYTIVDKTEKIPGTDVTFAEYDIHLTAIIDAKGIEYASWNYDDEGRAFESTHAGGAERTSIEFADGYSEVTNALGHKKQVHTDLLGRITHVVNENSSTEALNQGSSVTRQYEYDGRSGRYGSRVITDERGVQWHTRFDGYGMVSQEYEAKGSDEERSYSIIREVSNPTLIKTRYLPDGTRLEYSYDDQQRLTSVKRPGYYNRPPHRITTYAYNEQGLLASVDGPRTDVDDMTEITYDDRSRLSEVWVGGVLQQKVLAYDAYGRISEWQDGNGATYQQQYNHDGQLTRLRLFSADGSVDRTTTYEYDARGLLEKVTQADGTWVQYGYDDARRLTSVSDALGNRIDLTVDLAGNIEQTDVRDVNGALQRQHKAVYDQLSRLSQSIEPDTHAGDETQYDALGNAIAYTNALGTQSQSEFDALGRLSKYIDANNGETRYTYNADDQITSVTDPEGKKTEYQYNYFGDLEKIISPDTGTTTFAYDQAGNRTQSKNAQNEITTYQYDAQNRLIKTTYHDNSTVEYRYDLSSSANSVGRLSDVTDRQSHVTTYHYNAAGEVVKRVLSQGDASTNTANTNTANTEWHYAAYGQLQAMVYPSGAQLKPTYNSAGQITALTWQANGAAPQQTLVSEVNYQAFSGAINALTYGNGLRLQRDYALDGQITGSQLLSTSAIDPLRQREYTLDAINRITSIKQDGDWGSQQHGFDYDLLSRLTQAKQHGQQDDYSYDGIGNRLSHDNQGGDQPGNTTYGYASNSHKLDSIQGVNAQTVVVNALGQTTQLGERQFSYDPTGHIRTLTTSEGTTEYRYFPNQLRSQKIQGDQVTYYDYDLQGQLISERVSQNGGTAVTTREYLWLGNELLGYYTDGQLFFVHNDHLATPQAISDSQQNKVWSVQQKAFGESTLSDHQITFNIRFPGQYYDNESGLHYNWHRYYDTQLGRYLQSDPIGLNGGLSTFGYVYQNPMSWVDPDGLIVVSPQTIGGGLGFIIGGGYSYFVNGNDLGTALTDAVQAGAAGFISGGGSLFLGFATSATASAVRSKVDCGEVDVAAAFANGGIALAGGWAGKFAGAFVPRRMVQVERGFWGRIGEKVGLLGPKRIDANSGLRTKVGTTVGATSENIGAGYYSGSSNNE